MFRTESQTAQNKQLVKDSGYFEKNTTTNVATIYYAFNGQTIALRQGSATQNNGPFAANLQTQYTTDGSTWVNTGWTATPSYPYDSASTEGQTYVFTGAPINNVTGVRVVGQVHTATSNSWEGSVREVMAYAAQNASLLGGRKVWAKLVQPVAQQQGLGSVTVRQYYFFNGQQVAMRVCNGGCSAGNPGAVYFLHGDHLGSASLTTSNAGAKVSEMRYMPYGEVRYQWSNMPTDRRYTSQRIEGALGGVYDYNARFFNPLTARFLSADSIVPDGDNASIIPLTVDFHEPGFLAGVNGENALLTLQGWRGKDVKPQIGPINPQQINRFAYAVGNPLKYTDPTGHDTVCNFGFTDCAGARVVNRSKHKVIIRGDMLTEDGRLLQGVYAELLPYESSVNLGFVDVDEILVVDASIDGHTQGDFVQVRDGVDVVLTNDSQSGGISTQITVGAVSGNDLPNAARNQLFTVET
ncbi:MAG: hypothetical protein HC853_17445 [Anaerolineae bacterium]|nr:hypothetical protein [Anaerolineae bacterium]